MDVLRSLRALAAVCLVLCVLQRSSLAFPVKKVSSLRHSRLYRQTGGKRTLFDKAYAPSYHFRKPPPPSYKLPPPPNPHAASKEAERLGKLHQNITIRQLKVAAAPEVKEFDRVKVKHAPIVKHLGQGDGPLKVNFTTLHTKSKLGKNVRSYLMIVDNAVGHFSVEPGAGSEFVRVRAHTHRYDCKAEDPKAAAKRHKCAYAVNGGFFNMASGQCRGNLVHQNRVLQVDNQLRHPVIGLDRMNYLVAGYLSTQQVLATGGGFREMISGRGLLVKNYSNVVEESIKTEPLDNDMIHLKAPRTGIGFDADGRLYILQSDGEEDTKDGLSLREFAALFHSLHVLAAVNLDGGGSSVTVVNGTVFSKPTCNDNAQICTRHVPNIICIR